jgi:cyclophilin family peptidyl-prolyl cis-trans isomerase/FKBP-type peptidyl-prolyl cis-trans isomerase
MFRMVLPVLALAMVPLVAADQEERQEKKGPDPLHPRANMETSLGNIILELDAEKAPITVDNFLHYASDGFYNGTIFHRVVHKDPESSAIDVIQGGGFTPDMDEKKEGLRAPIKNEWLNLLKNQRGTIAMAREQEPDSATAQFFINTADNPSLDIPAPHTGRAAYAVFGKVVAGMDVVDKIRNAELSEHPKLQMGKVVPVEPIVIKAVTLLDGLSYDKVATAIRAMQEAEAKAAAERAKAFRELLEKGVDRDGNKLHKSPTGLMYVILKEGNGPSPDFVEEELRGTSVTDWLLQNPDAERPPRMNLVRLRYTAWLLDGTEFDNSEKRGGIVAFPLNGAMKGIAEGVSLMKVGGKHRLIIPAELGYGESGSRNGTVPPNATIIYDMELVGIR